MNKPEKLDIVTDACSTTNKALEVVRRLDKCRVEGRVASAGKANTRHQMIHGIEDIKTPLILTLTTMPSYRRTSLRKSYMSLATQKWPCAV